MCNDLGVWDSFLNNPIIYCHPFIDFSEILVGDELDWYTDSSGAIGMGGVWQNQWFYALWDPAFLKSERPSIEFLELFAIATSVLLWAPYFMNRQICLFYDNQAVIQMINNSTSSCVHCMALIRRITLKSLEHKVRIFAKFVPMKENCFANSLSRNQLSRFWSLARKHHKSFTKTPAKIPEDLWPVDKVWMK